jgi:hypothetical protein
MNDRSGTTVPLVCEAGIGAKQTLTHGAAAEGLTSLLSSNQRRIGLCVIVN